jgi:hypothetical protein
MLQDFSVLEALDYFGLIEDCLKSHPRVFLGGWIRKQDLEQFSN